MVVISFSRGSYWPMDRTWVTCIAGCLTVCWMNGWTQQSDGGLYSSCDCVWINIAQAAFKASRNMMLFRKQRMDSRLGLCRVWENNSKATYLLGKKRTLLRGSPGGSGPAQVLMDSENQRAWESSLRDLDLTFRLWRLLSSFASWRGTTTSPCRRNPLA